MREFKGTRIDVRSRHGDTEEQRGRAITNAMRKFKKMVQNENIIQDYREAQFYEKPTDKRRRRKAAAIRRCQKAAQEATLERGW